MGRRASHRTPGLRLGELLTAAGMTVPTAAGILGVSSVAVRRWTSGDSGVSDAKLPTVTALIRWLETETSEGRLPNPYVTQRLLIDLAPRNGPCISAVDSALVAE